MVTRLKQLILFMLSFNVDQGTRILVTDDAQVGMSSRYGNFKSDRLFDNSTRFDSCCCAMTEYESNPYFIIDLGAERPIVEFTVYGGDIDMYGGAGNLLDTSIWLQADISQPPNFTITEPQISATFSFSTDVTVRTIHIVRYTNNRFALCELYLWSSEIVSLNKTVTSREDRRCSIYQKYLASQATDGVYLPDDMCSHCASVSDEQIDPWIQLDLGQIYRVSFVSVYGGHKPKQIHLWTRLFKYKHDLLDSIQIYLEPMVNLTEPVYYSKQAVTSVHVPLTPDHLVRYVTIVRRNNYILTVCEIFVFTRECHNDMYGPDCSFLCGKCQPPGCDVIDGHCDQCLPGFYGDRCQFSVVPISEDSVMSSSNLESVSPNDPWSPAKSVDGIVDCNPNNQQCCSSTGSQTNPWLEITLTSPQYLTKLDIRGYSGQSDDFSGLSVFITSDYDMKYSTPVYTAQSLSDDNTVSVTLDPPVGARFVRLELPGNSRTLVICEIYVLGKDCPDHQYGPDCSSTCGQCLDQAQCDLLDGTCQQCEPGYIGSHCDHTCPAGMYGTNCTRLCGHCSEDTCNHVTGECVSCKNKYYGTKCFDRLVSLQKPVTLSTVYDVPNPLYWSGSRAVDGDTRMLPYLCRCCSGTLEETQPWLQLDLLQEFRLTRISLYGRMDSHDISLHDIKVYLAPVSEAVGEPLHAWTDYMTSVEIVLNPMEVSQYVTIVMEEEGQMTSLFVCEVQVFGEECEEGRFGPDCTTICRCLDGVTCDAITGYCPNKRCIPGWVGPSCNIPCDDGYFGMECKFMCGACVNAEFCGKSTGVCYNGCIDLYYGATCKDMESSMSEDGMIWGFISFGVLFVVCVSFFTFFKLKKMKQQRLERAYRLPPPEILTAAEVQVSSNVAEYQNKKVKASKIIKTDKKRVPSEIIQKGKKRNNKRRQPMTHTEP